MRRLLPFILLFLPFSGFAAGPVDNSWGFVPNRGQLGDAEVLYRGHQKGNSVAITRNAIVFEMAVPGPMSEAGKAGEGFAKQTIRLKLDGANAFAQVVPAAQRQEVFNYYSDRGTFLKVPSYGAIEIKEVYPGIDMILYAKAGGVKYDFRVNASADHRQIKLRWQGTTPTLTGNRLEYVLNGTFFYEDGLKASLESGADIPVKWQIAQDGTVAFVLPEKMQGQAVLIDPFLHWATYHGGSSNDRGHGVTADTLNNVYTCGYTFSSGMSTTGALQTTHGGNKDAFISGFDKFGVRLWTTYYGGANNDEANGIVADTLGALYVVGTSNSGGLATAGTHQTTVAGSSDVFLMKMTTGGDRTWATYYGGTAAEEGMGVAIDKSLNIFITGATFSSGGIATVGAYKPTYGGSSNADLFVARFNNNGTRSWGSYVGGANTERGLGIATDPDGNAIAVGIAFSSGLNTITSDNNQIWSNGTGLICNFKPNGTINWIRYFGHTGNDVLTCVATDASSNIYIGGYTTSSANIQGGSNIHQTSNAGGYDGVVFKLSPSGTRLGGAGWATFYGGSNDDYVHGIHVDERGDVYFTGETFSGNSSNEIATTDGLRTSNVGGADMFLVRMDNDNIRQWATYYGGKGDDAGKAVVKLRGSGAVYVAGYTTSDSAIASTGAHQTSHGGNDDAMLVKIEIFPCNGAVAPDISGNLTVCRRTAHTYSVDGGDNFRYRWIATHGTVVAGQGTNEVEIFWGDSASGTVKLIQYNSRDCADSATVTVSLLPIPLPAVSGKDTVCQTFSENYSVTNSSNTFAWTVTGGTITTGQNTNVVTVRWDDTGHHHLVVTETNPGSCQGIDSFRIFVSELPIPIIYGFDTVCQNTEYVYSAQLTNGSTYSWQVQGGIVVNDAGSSITVRWDGTAPHSVWMEERNIARCNADTTMTITVNPELSAFIATYRDTTVCEGTVLTFGDLAGTPNHTYEWFSKPSALNEQTPSITYEATHTVWIYLLETNENTGCTKVDSIQVIVNPLPPKNAGLDRSICEGDTTILGAPHLGPNFIYSWTSEPAGFTSSDAEPDVNPSETTTYYLELTSPQDCPQYDTVTVIVLPVPTIDAGLDGEVCRGDLVSLGTDNEPGFSYTWVSIPPGYISNEATPQAFAPDSTRAYALTKVNDATGCTSRDTVTIVVHQRTNPAITGASLACVESELKYQVQSSGGASWHWEADNGATILSGDNTDEIEVRFTREGPVRLLAAVANSGGCWDTTTFTVNIRKRFVFDVGDSGVICQGESVTLRVPLEVATATWSTGSTGRSVTFDQTGTYWVTGLSDIGCRYTDSFYLEVVPLPTVNLGPDTTICSGGSVVMNAGQGHAKYLWVGSGDTTPTIVVNRPGSYKVLVENSHGCVNQDERIVRVEPSPRVSLGRDTVVCGVGYIIEPETNGYRSYLWSDGSSLPFMLIDTSQTVWLMVTDNNGCTASDTVTIELRYDQQLYIPNSFSPNGDYVNDYFSVVGVNVESEFRIEIFNRWGARIFESTNPYFQWDGTLNGQDVQEGLYKYIVSYRDCRQFEVSRQGSIVLFR